MTDVKMADGLTPISPPSSPVKGLPAGDAAMIVLDWDDTLLPTTQLTDNYGEYITGGAELPGHVVADLEVLQDTVCRFIAEANAIGHVSVITNAMNGWVNLSGRLFIPRVLEALQKSGIEVIYAREKHAGNGDAEEWKMHAFCMLVKSMAAELPPPRNHLVSIGDSVFERNAAHYAAAEHATASIKTVKLIDPWEGPTIRQLEAQLRSLSGVLRETCLREESLDLAMEFSAGFSEPALVMLGGGMDHVSAPNASAYGL